MKKEWMAEAFGKRPGALHRALGVPEGEKIPAGKLSRAARSKSGLMRKRANLAKIGMKYGGRRQTRHSSSEAADALENRRM